MVSPPLPTFEEEEEGREICREKMGATGVQPPLWFVCLFLVCFVFLTTFILTRVVWCSI